MLFDKHIVYGLPYHRHDHTDKTINRALIDPIFQLTITMKFPTDHFIVF